MTAFYNKPWNPGYALPAYERAEDPLTRGDARTTSWLPRGTISSVKGLDKRRVGYSLPPYLRKEPVGSQAHTTPWIPRGTVMSMKGIKTGLPWVSNAHTLDSNGLGSLGDTDKGNGSVGGSDPIEQYGQKAAAVIVQDFKAIPMGERDAQLRELLNEIDPRLYGMFKKERGRLLDMGAAPAMAFKNGLAAAFTQGLVKEFTKLGKSKKVPKPGLRKGQVPLAALMGFEAQANNYQDLGGVWSKLKSTLRKIGGFACDVATNPITPIAAGGAAAFYGGGAQGASLAAAGVGVAAAACASGTAPGEGFVAGRAPREMPGWAIPAIIGGGALALILVLR